jgi:IPT/TIG domain
VSRNMFASSFNGDNGYRVRPVEELRHDLFSFVGVLASRVTVTGNTSSGPGSVYAGVEVAVAAESDVTITGNTFANPSPAKGAGSSLVRVSRPVERLVVSGNSFRNAESGVLCDVGQIGPTFSRNRLTAVTHPGSGCLSQVARVEAPGPLAVRGGTVVRVQGSGFGADLGAFRRSEFTATMNGKPVPLAWVSDTTLRATAPSGARNAAAVLGLLRGGVTVGSAPAGSYALA